eukprot:366216-Chlamydomonas_euryale.AAC.14
MSAAVLACAGVAWEGACRVVHAAWGQAAWGHAAWGQAAWGHAAWGQAAWGHAAWGQAAWGQAAWGQAEADAKGRLCGGRPRPGQSVAADPPALFWDMPPSRAEVPAAPQPPVCACCCPNNIPAYTYAGNRPPSRTVPRGGYIRQKVHQAKSMSGEKYVGRKVCQAKSMSGEKHVRRKVCRAKSAPPLPLGPSKGVNWFPAANIPLPIHSAWW